MHCDWLTTHSHAAWTLDVRRMGIKFIVQCRSHRQQSGCQSLLKARHVVYPAEKARGGHCCQPSLALTRMSRIYDDVFRSKSSLNASGSSLRFRASPSPIDCTTSHAGTPSECCAHPGEAQAPYWRLLEHQWTGRADRRSSGADVGLGDHQTTQPIPLAVCGTISGAQVTQTPPP